MSSKSNFRFPNKSPFKRSPSLFFQDSDIYSNYLDSSIHPQFYNDDLYQKQNQDSLFKQQRLYGSLYGPKTNLTFSAKNYANYKYFNSCTSDVIPDKVSKIFFSPQNISIVQIAIKGLIKIKTSFVIPDQSEAFLITIMLDVFQKCNKSLQYDFLEQVRTLNDIVIKQCVDNALIAIQAQDNYFKSLNKVYFLDSNPQATSIKGQNVIQQKKS